MKKKYLLLLLVGSLLSADETMVPIQTKENSEVHYVLESDIEIIPSPFGYQKEVKKKNDLLIYGMYSMLHNESYFSQEVFFDIWANMNRPAAVTQQPIDDSNDFGIGVLKELGFLYVGLEVYTRDEYYIAEQVLTDNSIITSINKYSNIPIALSFGVVVNIDDFNAKIGFNQELGGYNPLSGLEYSFGYTINSIDAEVGMKVKSLSSTYNTASVSYGNNNTFYSATLFERLLYNSYLVYMGMKL